MQELFVNCVRAHTNSKENIKSITNFDKSVSLLKPDEKTHIQYFRQKIRPLFRYYGGVESDVIIICIYVS